MRFPSSSTRSSYIGFSLIAQITQIVSAPILAHLYDPKAFGITAQLVAFVVIVNAFSTLRYETVIPSSRTERRAFAYTAIALLILIIFTILISFLVFKGYFLATLQLEISFALWPIIAVAIFSTASLQTIYLYCLRIRGISSIGPIKAIQSTFILLVSTLLSPLGYIGLIIGQQVGAFSGIFSYIIRTFKRKRPRLSKKFLVGCAMKGRNCISAGVPTALINSIGSSLPIILLASQFGSSDIGLYSMSQRCLIVATSVISAYSGDKLLVITRSELDSDITSKIKSNIQKNFFASFLMISLYLVGIYLFSNIFFGDKWNSLPLISLCLAPLALSQAVITPVIRSLWSVGLFKEQLVAQTLLFLFKLAPLALILILPNIEFFQLSFAIGSISTFGYLLACIYVFSCYGSEKSAAL